MRDPEIYNRPDWRTLIAEALVRQSVLFFDLDLRADSPDEVPEAQPPHNQVANLYLLRPEPPEDLVA